MSKKLPLLKTLENAQTKSLKICKLHCEVFKSIISRGVFSIQVGGGEIPASRRGETKTPSTVDDKMKVANIVDFLKALLLCYQSFPANSVICYSLVFYSFIHFPTIISHQ